MGKHSDATAQPLAECDVLRPIMELRVSGAASEDLKDKAKRCMKAVLGKCTHLMALQSLIPIAQSDLLAIILSQIALVVKGGIEERRNFLANGGLKLVQTLDLTDLDIAAQVEAINGAYPPEVVEYLKPEYAAALANKAGGT